MIPLFLKKLSNVQVNEYVGSDEFVGVGAGFTMAEGICRGLLKCLDRALEQQLAMEHPIVSKVSLEAIDDRHCQFYLKALTLMQGEVLIGTGKDKMYDFPVVWIGTKGVWHRSVGLNLTFALRSALQKALEQEQNREQAMESLKSDAQASSFRLEGVENHTLRISAEEQAVEWHHLDTAVRLLQQSGHRLDVFEMTMEPPLEKDEIKVFGVLLRKEEIT
jgi:hypothetical protein